MQDLRVIHEEVQVHPMVSWAAGPGPLGASSVLEPRVDLVLEEMVEEEEGNKASPHVRTADVEEGFSRTTASALTASKAPVNLATMEIIGHPSRGLEALDPVDLAGDPIVETVVSTMEGQVEGQALATSMETSEMVLFLVLDREDVLPTLVLGQQGGPDRIGHQVQVQAPRQQEDQHRPQPDGQEALLQLEDQAPRQQEDHFQAQHLLQGQPDGQAQDQQGDQHLHPQGNHLQDQPDVLRLDQPEDQTLVETGEDQNLVASEETEELDLTDCQDLASELAIDQVDRVDKVDKVDRADKADRAEELDLDKEDREATISTLEEDQGPMEEVLVEDQVTADLWTLEGHKAPMEEDLALMAVLVDLDLVEGRTVEALVEEAHKDFKSCEEDVNKVDLEERVEGLPLEHLVEDLLEASEVVDDQEALGIVVDLEASETEDVLEALEMEAGQETLETEGVLEVLEMEDAQEALETEDALEVLETGDSQMTLVMEEGLEALEASEDRRWEAIEVLAARVAVRVNKVWVVLGDEVDYQVALVAGTAWAVVLGSVILTPGEAKKCRALAPG